MLADPGGSTSRGITDRARHERREGGSRSTIPPLGERTRRARPSSRPCLLLVGCSVMSVTQSWSGLAAPRLPAIQLRRRYESAEERSRLQCVEPLVRVLSLALRVDHRGDGDREVRIRTWNWLEEYGRSGISEARSTLACGIRFLQQRKPHGREPDERRRGHVTYPVEGDSRLNSACSGRERQVRSGSIDGGRGTQP